MALPVIAIVGRPNVGKSALFNRLVGTRISIVQDTPGVTRDRIYADCEWSGKTVRLVDTGGIEPYSTDPILSQMRRQANLAIESAEAIIMVVDVTTGVTANDHEVALMLQKSGRPVVLCVNKCDRTGQPPAEFYEFYNLGLGEPIAVSSLHGTGTGDLLDAAFALVDFDAAAHYGEDSLKVAIIGRPNVGKSSLVNRLAGEERVLVSPVAGTTRDATDTLFENEYGRYLFIDTAGIRRQSKVEAEIEHYSVLRAYMAVDRCDVALILIDGEAGFSAQDARIAGYAHEQGKGCVVAVNKWDAVPKETNTMAQMEKSIRRELAFMDYAHITFLSAKTGQRLDTLFPLLNQANENNALRITTGRLNELLAYATARVQPPTDKGRRLRIYYMTQTSTRPPTFVLFANDKELFHFSYQRYLENQIRETFSLEGTPVRFIIRERGNDKD